MPKTARSLADSTNDGYGFKIAVMAALLLVILSWHYRSDPNLTVMFNRFAIPYHAVLLLTSGLMLITALTELVKQNMVVTFSR
jgi:uncharacterized membrane protein YjjP (DUF1212 family)